MVSIKSTAFAHELHMKLGKATHKMRVYFAFEIIMKVYFRFWSIQR